MKFFQGIPLVVGIVICPQAGGTMYTERGVGEYGIRFSHFCGPVLWDSSFDNGGNMGRLSFGMNEIHLQATSSYLAVNDKVPYHVSRGPLSTKDIHVSIPLSEKVLSFLRIVAPSISEAPGISSAPLNARLDQRFRILLLYLPTTDSPVVFSSKFCNFDSTDANTSKHDIQWEIPGPQYNRTDQATNGFYYGTVLTPLGSQTIILNISTDQFGSKSGCFSVRRSGIKCCIPLSYFGRVLMFDSTNPEYAEVMSKLFIKKWSNHLLVYDPYYQSIHWKIGWNDYVLFFEGAQSRRSEGKLFGDSLSVTGSWYCAKHDKYSYVRLRIEDDSDIMEFDYKPAYTFPWSRRFGKIQVMRSGAVFWLDHTNPGVSDLVTGISGKKIADFVHLVWSPNKRRLYLTVSEAPTLVFVYC